MRINELQINLKKLKENGYVKTLREGSTGIGYTFESMMGVSENNIPIPDIGGRLEIKTTRRDSNSLITLFTFNRGIWRIKQKELIEKYGYIDSKGRLALKRTLSLGSNGNLVLKLNEEKLAIYLLEDYLDEEGILEEKAIAIWDLFVIIGKFMSKMGKVLYVIADRKIEDGEEYFWYNEAYILSDPSPKKFLDAFKNLLVCIDLRMHLKEQGGVRNRGTAFRVVENKLPELYEKIQRII